MEFDTQSSHIIFISSCLNYSLIEIAQQYTHCYMNNNTSYMCMHMYVSTPLCSSSHTYCVQLISIVWSVHECQLNKHNFHWMHTILEYLTVRIRLSRCDVYKTLHVKHIPYMFGCYQYRSCSKFERTMYVDVLLIWFK